MASWELPTVKANTNPVFIRFLVRVRRDLIFITMLAESDEFRLVCVKEWILLFD
jgi:hypothetical protein